VKRLVNGDAEDFVFARVQDTLPDGQQQDIRHGDRLARVRADVIEAKAR
jgi:hypothetical protein